MYPLQIGGFRLNWHTGSITGAGFRPHMSSAIDQCLIGIWYSTHDRLFGIELPPVVARRRRSAEDSCDRPRWSPRYCLRPPSVDDFTRTHRNIHGDNEPTLRSTPPDDFNEPRTTILGPHPQPPLCCKPRPDAPLFNEKFERSRYMFGTQNLNFDYAHVYLVLRYTEFFFVETRASIIRFMPTRWPKKVSHYQIIRKLC